MIRTTGFCLMLSLIAPAAYGQTSSETEPMAAGGAATQPQLGAYQVFFGLGSAKLNGDALAAVTAAANEYRRTGTAELTVTGHTDTTGSAEHNMELSQRRAEAVARNLSAWAFRRPQSRRRPRARMICLSRRVTAWLAQNRRVQITLQEPPPPAAVAAVQEPVMAAVDEVEKVIKRGRFGLGLYYGANLLNEGDNSGEDNHQVTHLTGLNLTFDYLLNNWLNLSVEQAGFYNFNTDDEGLGGRTVAGLDFVFASREEGFGSTITNLLPYVGLNIGGIYGSGLNDDFIWGPEIGLNIGPIVAKIAYDMPFDRNMDEASSPPP